MTMRPASPALSEIAHRLAAQKQAGELDGARDILFAVWRGTRSFGFDALCKSCNAERHEVEFKIAAYFNMDMIGRLRERA